MLTTMAVAISMGVFLTVASRRIHVSSIVLLLVGGVLLGPEGLGLVDTRSLGDGLSVIVSLSVGLILFEGGLTLDLRGYRPVASVIHRLLSVGLLVTWLTTAAAIHCVFDYDLAFSLLSASLVVVTGPTVIAPLLKRIKVNINLHSILHWEGVLIDPVGVFIAILCFEWLTAQSRGMVVARFVLRFVWGIGLGIAGGLAIHRVIRSRLIPDDVMNVFALGPSSSSVSPNRSSRSPVSWPSPWPGSSSASSSRVISRRSASSKPRSPISSSAPSSFCWPHGWSSTASRRSARGACWS
jgi:NhaP-type Na+/H+ or K+/H+ antiporter